MLNFEILTYSASKMKIYFMITFDIFHINNETVSIFNFSTEKEMNVNEQHAIVKKSLSQFIKKNISGANLKNVDQIVLEYVISILEEASQDESFDVEG